MAKKMTYKFLIIVLPLVVLVSIIKIKEIPVKESRKEIIANNSSVLAYLNIPISYDQRNEVESVLDGSTILEKKRIS